MIKASKKKEGKLINTLRTYDPDEVEEFNRKLNELVQTGYPKAEISRDANIPYFLVNRCESYVKSIPKIYLKRLRRHYKKIDFYTAKYKIIDICKGLRPSKTSMELLSKGLDEWEIVRLKR